MHSRLDFGVTDMQEWTELSLTQLYCIGVTMGDNVNCFHSLSRSKYHLFRKHS